MALASYTDLQTAIRQYTRRTTGSDADFETNIPNFISLGETWINRALRIRAMETLGAATTIAGLQTVALPTGYQALRSINLVNSPDNFLEYMAPQQLRTRFRDSTTTGTPKFYSIVGENFLLGPIPDAAYEIDLLYYMSITPLATTPTNTVLSQNPDIYLHSCVAEAYGYLRDWDSKKTYYAQAQQIATDIMTLDEQDRHSGSAMQVRARFTP